jgi:long-chain acyl-CoA synthetase
VELSQIVERFRRIVRDTPSRPLIHLPLARTTITAEELQAAASTQRGRLEQAGIGPDHVVIYAAGNRPELFGLWLACRELGVVLLPADVGTTTGELAALAGRFGASALIVAAGTAATSDDLGDSQTFVPGLAVVRPQGVTPSVGAYSGACTLKLTSGSTGEPKATFTTEAQLVLDSEHITTAMGIGPDDCQMAAIPLSHAYGIGNLLVPLLIQGTAIVLREAFVPHQFATDATTYGARAFPGVPFMFDHFNAHLPPGAWPSRLTALISAGARLEPSTVRAFHSSFGVKIHSFYGTTEAGGIAYDESADTDEADDQPVVGRPLPDVTISLQPEEGAPPDGGRVHVASGAVASGYADGEPFETGGIGHGFLTGDFGRFDRFGRLLLTGRVSSFINVAGRKVQPEEVEAVLRAMPGIVDVRVIGAPDPARGQQIVACLVPSGQGPSTLDVRHFCAPRLAAYKIPRTIVVMDRIPLTERGKTDRRQLQTAVEEHLRGASGTGVL